MQFEKRAHPGRKVRLSYCQNLHPADTLDGVIAGLRGVTLPLRDRLGVRGSFGIGMYLPMVLARHLAGTGGERDLYRLSRLLEAERLDPFTFNAFPIGGFGSAGLKAAVFEPSWREPERVAFTTAVARVACELVRRTRADLDPRDHVSISTHTGGHGSRIQTPRDVTECALNQTRAADELARIEDDVGVRGVLALEPEPRANANDQVELDAHLARLEPLGVALLEEERNRASERAPKILARHLGACLDACHAAVEGEDAAERIASGARRGPAKLQASNALVVLAPRANSDGVAALLALDEPRYLHQVTGHRDGTPLRVGDLPELRAALDGPERDAWLDCREWRCHFHVPVDLDRAGLALSTTRADSDRILDALLVDPARWSTSELHVEIETYTWDILPGWARGEGALVDGLEREYRHVLARLAAHEWVAV